MIRCSPFLLPLGVVLVLLVVWLIFRSRGYKRDPLDVPPRGDFRRTEERFRDPATGEMLEVWYCARTGERAYVRAR